MCDSGWKDPGISFETPKQELMVPLKSPDIQAGLIAFVFCCLDFQVNPREKGLSKYLDLKALVQWRSGGQMGAPGVHCVKSQRTIIALQPQNGRRCK